MATVHLISEVVSREKGRRGPVKIGDVPATKWRQDMQIRWLEAAVAAQERHDEPKMDQGTLRLPCPQT